jgi:hypothetical protein
MASSGSNPTLQTQRIPADEHHPAHPAVIAPANPPFTLLVDPGSDPPTYTITFFNSGTDQTIRIYLMAFLSSQPSNPIWTDDSLTCPPNFQPPYNNPITFDQSDLGDSDTLWIGTWWDDGTYATAQAYFEDHPAGGGHHTVPITVG